MTEQIEVMQRPVGHVTDQIKSLNRWLKNRTRLNLPVKDLSVTILYLEEYRDLINKTNKREYRG